MGRVAYVDTSCLAAIIFGEPAAASMARRITRAAALVSSNLLEAELRAAAAREAVPWDASAVRRVAWISPDRPLHDEIERVLEAGYVRGADCWHLAAALYLAPDPSEIDFLTLDSRQRSVAAALGFGT
jgi:predicted nucleic acid-binding protein